MSSAPSSLSGDAGLTGTFGSTSGQVAPSYSSGPGNLGQLDVASEAIKSTPAALLSASSIPIGSASSLTQQTTENDLLNASFPSTTSASELHSVDTSNIVKEMGPTYQPLPSLAATEHLGSSVSETSLSTRDALDKYQIVAQKVEYNSFFFCFFSCPTCSFYLLGFGRIWMDQWITLMSDQDKWLIYSMADKMPLHSP